MLLDGLGDGLERLVVLDVVGVLDHRIILGAVILDDLLVVDDAVPFGGVRQRVGLAVDGVGVGLAFVVEHLEHFGVLQRFDMLLILGELVEAGHVEHGRRVGFGQFGGHGRIVGAGGAGLHVDLHAGFLGVHGGELLVLVHHFGLVVHKVHVAFVGVGAGAAASGERESHGEGRRHCDDPGGIAVHDVLLFPCWLKEVVVCVGERPGVRHCNARTSGSLRVWGVCRPAPEGTQGGE